MKNNLCQYWLTCKDREEATSIANLLLEKRLITCAKQVPVKASYWWEGKLEHSEEILLIMDSKNKFFGKIEMEVAKLHSYDTFVLQEVEVNNLSNKALGWMENELTSGNS